MVEGKEPDVSQTWRRPIQMTTLTEKIHRIEVLCGDDKAWAICVHCHQRYLQEQVVNDECRLCAARRIAAVTERATRRIRLIEVLGGPVPYELYTTERFQVDEGTRKAYDAVIGFNVLRDNLYLYGRCGVGKSHLAGIVVRNIFESGKSAKIVQPASVLRAIRGKSGDEEQAMIDFLVGLDCLVLDEIGFENSSEFSLRILYEIVERRWKAGRNGLIVTSNLSLRDLAKRVEDDRLLSRLVGMCTLIRMTGKDWRQGLGHVQS